MAVIKRKSTASCGAMQGFAELEYGMLRWMGAADDSTLIVTSGKITLSAKSG